ncbi:MAG TPA: phosphopantetheine-binding protein, partial [Pyrinomonadaceae bacterium]|nr:phosphopantetheine-binding protein [Pyrinomonadaceae bacterium]
HTPGDKRLVAYVVGDAAAPPTVNQLQSFLQQKLPGHMIPSTFMLLDALPLSPSGKVNREALPEPDRVRPNLEATFVAPQTEMELLVSAIWREVLQVDEVGIDDNFFDLGGHSLLMIKLNSRLRETLAPKLAGQEIPIVNLFQYPTIRSLSQFLSRQQQDEAADAQANGDKADKLMQGKQRLSQQRRRMQQATKD